MTLHSEHKFFKVHDVSYKQIQVSSIRIQNFFDRKQYQLFGITGVDHSHPAPPNIIISEITLTSHNRDKKRAPYVLRTKSSLTEVKT